MRLRSLLQSLAAALICLIAIGCHDQSSDVSASGIWRGKDGDRSVELRIFDSSGTLAGAGTITNPDGAIIVEGTRVEHTVSFGVQVEIDGGYSFGRFEGELLGPFLVGELSGLAFATDRIVLVRSIFP